MSTHQIEMSTTSSHRRWLGICVGLALLMGIQFGLINDTIQRTTPTVDEVAHLPAGLSYLETGTFKMYRHSPPLARFVAALAAYSQRFPLVFDRSWRHSEPAHHWVFAFEALARSSETPEERQRYLAAFTNARRGIAAWATLGIPLLYLWGRWWVSAPAGWLAALLWTFSPNIIAHAGLVTTDLAATVTFLAASLAFARWLAHPNWFGTFLAGTALGLSQLVKFSALWLYPTFLIWAVAFGVFHRLTSGRKAPWWRWLWRGTAILAMSVAVINLGYLGEGTGTALGDFPFLSQTLTRPRQWGDPPLPPTNNLAYRTVHNERTNRFVGTLLDRFPCPLPFHFVAGFDEQKFEAEGKYPMYLRGKFADTIQRSDLSPTSRRGWWYYYFYAMWVKIPLSTWILATVGIVSSLRAGAGAAATWLFLGAVPVAVMSFLTDINIGVRYTLTSFPYLFLLAGCTLGPPISKIRIAIAAVAIAWNLVVIARIHPRELEYFNELVGGPANGRFHLIDSNLDWGQGLRGLSHWIEDNPEWREVRLAYMGSIPPEFEGIEPYRLAPRDLRQVPDHRLLPWENRSDARTWGPQPGKYAISVNFERGMRFHTPAPLEDLLERQGRLGGALLPGSQMIEIPRGSYAYFQQFTPMFAPEVGYSILLYDVTVEDANRARAQMGLPPWE